MIEVLETMPGPPEVVWELITDWEHQGDWMLEASDFEVIGEQREGWAWRRGDGPDRRDPDARPRAHRAVGAPRILVIDHLGWVKGSGEIQLAPIQGGTRMRWRETLFRPSDAGSVRPDRLRAFRPWMRRIFRRDLRVLRSLVAVRGRAAGGGDG